MAPAQTGCRECGFDWDAPPAELTDILRQIARALPSRLGIAQQADTTAARPAPGVWSRQEYLGHIGDVLVWYRGRIEGVLAEDRPVMVGLDWALETDRRRYDRQPPERLMSVAVASLRGLAEMLDGLNEGQWARRGIGSEGQERTVLMLARRAVHEAHHHLGDLGP
ncbi:MAG TPA: DinB family protein [Acidimicrobiales bacterium]|nr:DinB family protein [Acidimicrobiales bacterium]